MDSRNALGLRNDVKIKPPLFYLHVVLDKAVKFTLPTEHSERGFYSKGGYRTVRNYLLSASNVSA